jgi:hypothetical protein
MREGDKATLAGNVACVPMAPSNTSRRPVDGLFTMRRVTNLFVATSSKMISMTEALSPQPALARISSANSKKASITSNVSA